MTRRLILSPHVDDDVLGCGGILDANTVTFYCGVDDLHHGATADQRFAEAMAVARRAGSRFYWPREIESWMRRPEAVAWPTERAVNHYGERFAGLIADFEQVIVEERPEEVLIPWPSYNQDHRAVFEAARVALRPHDTVPFVPRVLIYEQPHVAMWDQGRAQFRPILYQPIDIEEKLARYECMPSQVRDFRSPATIRALAALRGAAARVPFAEAFGMLRWVRGAADE